LPAAGPAAISPVGPPPASASGSSRRSRAQAAVGRGRRRGPGGSQRDPLADALASSRPRTSASRRHQIAGHDLDGTAAADHDHPPAPEPAGSDRLPARHGRPSRTMRSYPRPAAGGEQSRGVARHAVVDDLSGALGRRPAGGRPRSRPCRCAAKPARDGELHGRQADAAARSADEHELAGSATPPRWNSARKAVAYGIPRRRPRRRWLRRAAGCT